MRPLRFGFPLSLAALALVLFGCSGPLIPGPRILTHPFPVQVNLGETASFTVVAEGSSTLHYRWFKNGVLLPGADSSHYTTPALGENDNLSTFQAEVRNQEGTVRSLEATVSIKPPEGQEFPIGVWMQSPTKQWEGRSRAQVYRDLGVNTFMGLWGWPVEAYPGSNTAAMEALKAAGMKAYTGPTQDLWRYHNGDIRGLMDKSLEWLRNNPGYEEVFVGFILGDEADMAVANYAPDQDPPTYAWAVPETFKENSLYFRNTLTQQGAGTYGSLKFFGNFGKPFSKGQNFFKGAGNRRTPEEMAADFQLYIDPLDQYSSDYYGITEPYELRENHGVWTYGRSVSTAARWATGSDGQKRDLWGFLEASAPWREDNYKVEGNYLTQRQQPEYIAPIVWNMIIHGATGIIYFCHDFLTPQSGISDAGCLYEPGIPQAMAAVNAQVQSYAPFLLSSEPGPSCTVSVTGPVPVSHLAKSRGVDVRIFAQGDGSTAYPDGAPVSATFQVGGGPWSEAVVLGENRTIPVVTGAFSDTFDPYEVHIYQLK